MGPSRNFSRGVQTQRLVKGWKAYLSSVYLTNTTTCCRISLCRKESNGFSVSDTLHGYSVLKNTEKQNPGSATAPPCTCLLAPLLDPSIHLSIYLSIHPSTHPPVHPLTHPSSILDHLYYICPPSAKIHPSRRSSVHSLIHRSLDTCSGVSGQWWTAYPEDQKNTMCSRL